jgi:hypothetical protein
MLRIHALHFVLAIGAVVGVALRSSASDVTQGLAKVGNLPKKGVLRGESVIGEIADEPIYLPPTNPSPDSAPTYGGFDPASGHPAPCGACGGCERCEEYGCLPDDLWWQCSHAGLWYVGLEGGFVCSLTEADATPDFAHGAELEETFNIGFRLGKWVAPRLRLDASYTLIDENYNWEAQSPPAGIVGDRFLGDLRSHIALMNVYWHPDWFGDQFYASPYVGAGLGVAVNHLRDANELTPPTNTTTQVVAGGTLTSLAARATTGIQIRVTAMVAVDLSASAIYMGDIESGAFRTSTLTGITQGIAPFAFGDNLVFTANLALILTPDAG